MTKDQLRYFMFFKLNDVAVLVIVMNGNMNEESMLIPARKENKKN